MSANMQCKRRSLFKKLTNNTEVGRVGGRKGYLPAKSSKCRKTRSVPRTRPTPTLVPRISVSCFCELEEWPLRLFQRFENSKVCDSVLIATFNGDFRWKSIGSIFETVLVTMIPANPYFWPKSGERDVTLTFFTVNLSGPWTIPSVSMCEIDKERGVQSSVAISLFFSNGRKSEWGDGSTPHPHPPPHPQWARERIVSLGNWL